MSLTDPRIFDILAGGVTASSGIKVNRNTALGYPAVWRAVNLISRDVAKLPLIIFRRLDPGGKDRAIEHPAYRLIRSAPSDELGAFQFRMTLTAHALLSGNGYAHIVRNRGMEPIRLNVLLPENTYPVREDGRLLYITRVNNQSFKLDAADVLHIRGLGYDGLIGYSVVEKLRESLGLGLAAQAYGSVFFRNNAKPSIVIEVPYKFKDAEAVQDFRDRWMDKHGGVWDSHTPAILENGGKVHTLSMSNEDSQFIETQEFGVRQVANILGCPSHKLGDTAKTSFASLEMEQQRYLDECLDPWLVTWEEECRDKLLSEREKERDTHMVEFVRAALLRADKKTESEVLINEVNAGLLSVNEARAIQNRNPIEDEEGDAYRRPLNIGTMGQDDPEDVERSLWMERVLESQREAIELIIRRITKRLGAMAKRQAKNPKQFMSWLDDFEASQRSSCWMEIAPSIKAYTMLCEGSTGNRASEILDAVFSEVRQKLLESAGRSRPETLLLEVDKDLGELESKQWKDDLLAVTP